MRRGLALAVLALLLGCRQTIVPRGLVIAYPLGPASLVPYAANEELSLSVLGNVYEPLVALDADLALVPRLAESWHSPDDLTWVFRLRQGVRRHDGRPLEARDVVASLLRARSDPASKQQTALAVVESIEATDTQTVVVRTRRPFETLPASLSGVLVSVDARPPDQGPVGTGPYRIQAWTPGGTTVLEAFADYWGGAPPIPFVEFRALPDVGERLRQLRSGRVHLVVDVPAEEMAALGADRRLRTASRKGMRVLFLAMDCAREVSPYVGPGRNPFRDPRVRRAVALAVDRQALVSGPLGGLAEVVDRLATAEEMGGAPGPLSPKPADPEEARRLLAIAGYGRGFDVTLDFVPGKFRAIEEVVRSIVAELGRVGIRAVPRDGPPYEAMGRIASQDTSLYLVGWMSDSGEASLSYAALLHSRGGGFGAYNNGGYSDPEVDRLIEEASARHAPGERDEVLQRVAEKVASDVPVVPLYRQVDLYAIARELEFTPRLDRRIEAATIRWRR